MSRFRYTVRRIAPSPAARLGCVLGWVVACLPALCLAGLSIGILQAIHQAFERLEPVVIRVLGQEVARIDLLEILRLGEAFQTVDGLLEYPAVTFILLAGASIVGLGLLFLALWLLVILGYNLLASAGWGLEVELADKTGE